MRRVCCRLISPRHQRCSEIDTGKVHAFKVGLAKNGHTHIGAGKARAPLIFVPRKFVFRKFARSRQA